MQSIDADLSHVVTDPSRHHTQIKRVKFRVHSYLHKGDEFQWKVRVENDETVLSPPFQIPMAVYREITLDGVVTWHFILNLDKSSH